MQHVSAFTRPETVPAAPSRGQKRNLWILSSWRDLVLYVCTPLLIVPVFLVAQARWSAEDIYLFVAAFGAMGHHLPGMIRAYGDRALFQRFKWRFIVAPAFLVLVCATFFLWDLKAIVLVTFIWGVWHGMMQTYGFCRIYDAKAGSFAAVTRRLDFAVCAIWFATAVLLSPKRMTDTLDSYYAAGAPFIPPPLFRAMQAAALVLTAIATALFIANFFWSAWAGRRPNPVKLALLASSITFWWYCNNIVANILVGVALFEVFHDVQYLSLVWIYNRKRVESDSSIGGFMRFVFRRSGSLVGLYLGLIFAYGALGLFKSSVGIESLKRIFTGIVTASALLHFYYDGFIWKVREKSTRESLGIVGGTTETAVRSFLPTSVLHGAKWALAFVIPLAALWFTQVRSARSEIDKLALIAADLPNSVRAHLNYANSLQDAGRVDEAAEEFSTVLRLDPKSRKAHANLASILMGKGQLEEARSHFETAVRIDPNDAEYHSGYAFVLDRLGHFDEAKAECEAAVRASPRSALAWYSYGAFLDKHGRSDEAIAQYRRALQLDRRFADAHLDLADALFARGDLAEAEQHYLQGSRLQPKLAQPHNSRGRILMQQGKISEAIAEFEQALRLHADFPEAEQNLRLAKAADPQASSAPSN